MGQKVNPIIFRVGISRPWQAHWYREKKEFRHFLAQDIHIRKYLSEALADAGISSITINRLSTRPRIKLCIVRPGVLIGKKGAGIEQLRKKLMEIVKQEVQLDVIEVRNPDTDAKLIADNIAQQLEKRVPYRRATKRAVQGAMRLGAKGIKISCKGRLGGIEIAREERVHEGPVPLHTLRSYIDYGTASAYTTYGVCGVKVWVYKEEKLGQLDTDYAKDKQSPNTMRFDLSATGARMDTKVRGGSNVTT